MGSAEKWLELNYDQHDRWFLHVDTFDPHEPWDPPRWYTDLYDPGWQGGEIPGVAYVQNRAKHPSELTKEQLKHLRALYAGEVSLVDRWVGRLLEKVGDLGLFEDTLIIFTSDHGTYLGEHGWIGKRGQLYEEVAHIPLIIRPPDSLGCAANRTSALVQPTDLMPTILDLANKEIPEGVQGKTLLPIMRGQKDKERDIAVSSPGLAGPRLPKITVTSDEWVLLADMVNPPEEGKAGKYPRPPREIESELYHLPSDIKQERNLNKTESNQAEELRDKMIKFLKQMRAKQEIISLYSQE
jgi:arylsulfatase A-like enzyme